MRLSFKSLNMYLYKTVVTKGILLKCHVDTHVVMIVISLKLINVAFTLVNICLGMVPVYVITRIT